MANYLLFSDGSVDNDSKIGFGAYLIINNKNLVTDELKPLIIVQIFENTSSTKLELQTLLLALNEVPENANKITVYTDSQNITGLPGRREYFEKNNYSTRRNKTIINSELYKAFYKKTDELNCEFIKVEGHKTSDEKDDIDKIFALVDKVSRNSLRRFSK